MENIPDYASFDSPQKFEAIKSIIAKRLTEHPKAVCSYSGGADSDVMLDLLQNVITTFNLPPIHYVFYNTGLEMKATKDHVKEQEKKYGIEIEEVRPKVGIVQAVRKCGIPFISKIASECLGGVYKKNIPVTIADEFAAASDKKAKRQELRERYPKSETEIDYLCCCKGDGSIYTNTPVAISSTQYLLDFLKEYPPDFAISKRCCDYCKKQPAHKAQKDFEMVITGERRCEGGVRTIKQRGDDEGGNTRCFRQVSNGQYRLRPLYYVTDKDKAWYKEYHNLRYSDAYEVYGLTRTGCCGCPINHKAIDDLERIRPYEPNIVKAAWNIFGKSYLYRQKYNEYKAYRREQEKQEKAKGSKNE